MKSKQLSFTAHTIMILSAVIIVLDFYGIFFIRVSESSRINDITFVTVLILGTLFFFVGGLLDQKALGIQPNEYAEHARQSSMKSAWYGVIACSVSFILLMLALVYTH